MKSDCYLLKLRQRLFFIDCILNTICCDGDKMQFYDLYIRAEDLEKAVEFGEKLGYEGIGLATEFEDKDQVDGFVDDLKELRDGTDIDIISACEIDPESVKEMKREIGKVRQKVEVVIVRGGDFEINKNAVRDSRVDLLVQPERNRKDSGLDHKTARLAAENEVAIGIALHPLINTYGRIRSHVMNHIKRILRLCEKYDARSVVVSGAMDAYEMRDPRELASLPQVLGFDTNSSMGMVSSKAEEIFKENRKKLGGEVEKDGVEEVY